MKGAMNREELGAFIVLVIIIVLAYIVLVRF